MSVARGAFGESWRAWTALGVGVLAVSAHSASSVNLSVLMKSILGEFDWSRSEWAAASTLRLVALVIAMPLVGRATDRLGARTVLGVGAAIVGLALGGVAAMRSYAELAGLSVVMGPAQACVGSVAASALVLRLFRRHRALAVGILNGGDNVLNAGVPRVSVGLLESFGWRSAVVAMGGVYLLLGVLVRSVLREADGQAARETGDGSLRRTLPWDDARWWAIVGAYAAIYAWVTSLQLHFHAYQTDLGRSPALAAELLSTQILVGAIGAPLAGLAAEHTSARLTLVVVTVGLAIAAGTVWNVHDLWALRAWAVGYGLVNSGVVALLVLVLEECFGGARIGSLLGGAMFFCMGATLLANQFTAWTFDHYGTYVPAWQTYTALMAFTIMPVTWLWRRGAPAVARRA